MLKLSWVINVTLTLCSLVIIYSLVMTKSNISQKKRQITTLSRQLDEATDWQDALKSELNLRQSRSHVQAVAEAYFGPGIVSTAEEVYGHNLPDRAAHSAGRQQALDLFSDTVTRANRLMPSPLNISGPESNALANSALIERLIQHITEQTKIN